ncbi:MAG: hypothetical protein IJ240_10690 [Clostridia bacterium]|nr:hypothetical protein [Clostridia bacterium]
MKKRGRSEHKVNMQARYLAFLLGILASFSLLVYGLYNLQIVNGESYAASAGTQSNKTIVLKGTRGMITDAEGVILAKSEKIYNVTFQRDNSQSSASQYKEFTEAIIETIDIIKRYGGELSVTFPIQRDEETGEWVFNFGSGISEEATATRMSQWRSNHYLTARSYPTAEDCLNRLKRRYQMADDIDEMLMLEVMAVYSEMQMNIFNSLPIVIAKDIAFSAVGEIEGRSVLLPGIGIEVGEKRIYPRSTLASQIIGYTGKIQNMESYRNEYRPAGYALNDEIGLDGIEKSQENWLTACISERQGSRVMERDNNGKLTRQISYTEPQDGNNVKLTIIASYQQRAERAIQENVEWIRDQQEEKMQDGDWLEINKEKINIRDWEEDPVRLAEKGVLIVMDVKTGKLLAMAQYPTYDLNAMVAGGEAAREIVADPRGLLMNYAIQTRAEPGSTFKMVTGLAALTNGVITPTTEISDGGKFMKYTRNEAEAPTCWTNHPENHKDQNIVRGLTNSCNYFFYTLGSYLYGDDGSDRLYKYAAQMGLTSKTGIELNGELRSIVGNQTNLYDPTVSLSQQVTDTPIIVANAIKTHIRNFASSYGITYDDNRLNVCIKQLMDMAINTGSDYWVLEAQKIFMQELNMTRNMVYMSALMSDLWNYLNTIKWGGSLEIQMAIGQSITLVTPVAEVRYAAALVDGNVWNLSIVDSITSPDGELLSQRTPQLFGQLENVEEFLPYIKEGMKGVVDETGTARKFFSGRAIQSQIWAKTGTSQITVGKIKIDIENNAWFVCLTPYDDPQLALVSYIPNGYSGGYSSIAARDWIEWWMTEQNKVVSDISLTAGNELTP